MFAHDMELFKQGLDILNKAIIFTVSNEDGDDYDNGVRIEGITEDETITLFEWLTRFNESTPRN